MCALFSHTHVPHSRAFPVRFTMQFLFSGLEVTRKGSQECKFIITDGRKKIIS